MNSSDAPETQCGDAYLSHSLVPLNAGYRLVKLANGAWSIYSVAVGETCHPAIGPVAEAEALYWYKYMQGLERGESGPDDR